MASFVYVDNVNVWMGGQYWSAVMRGDAPDVRAAERLEMPDRNWHPDFGKLLSLAKTEDGGIKRVLLVGTRPPPSDSVWDVARKGGFEVDVFDTNSESGKAQARMHIAVEMISDSYEKREMGDEFVLMSGDERYVPLIRELTERDIPAKAMFWAHADSELIGECTQFISLNPHINDITR